jgi:hypothetical protein
MLSVEDSKTCINAQGNTVAVKDDFYGNQILFLVSDEVCKYLFREIAREPFTAKEWNIYR